MNELKISSKKALFVCYGGGHISTCLPVILELKSRGWHVDLIALTTAFKYAQNFGLSPLGFKDFIEESDLIEIDKCGVDFGKDKTSLISSDESKAYLGLSYLDLVNEYGMAKAKELYGKEGRKIFFPLRIMRRIIKKINPNILVTTAAPRAEHAAQIAASEYGIKRVCFLSLPDEILIKRVVSFAKDLNICVVDSHTKKILLDSGVPEEKIHITGNPAYDSLWKVQDFEIKMMKNRLNIKNGKKIILWASQVEPERDPVTGELGDANLPRKIESVLREMVSLRDDFQLVVRYHPNEISDFSIGKNVSLSPREDDISVLLHLCDLVVTMTSTVAFQAANLSKPVVSVDLSVFSKTLGLSKLGVSRGVKNIFEIPAVINEILWVKKEKIGSKKSKKILSSVEFANVVESVLNN